ncbi:MAG: META domain-containing protein [Chitinophagaceae bacterium]|nr:META domain-containing protein [Chitinophagaceae bacterium]
MIIKQIFIGLGISFLLLQTFSCKSSKTTASGKTNEAAVVENNTNPIVTGNSEELYMHRWYLSSVYQKEVRTETGRTAYLTFSPGQVNTVAGFTGCNRLSGSFTINGNNEIRFSPLAVTKMACANDKTESIFLPVLAETNRWSVENGVLKFYKEDKEVAAFTAVDATAEKLEGNWELNYISGPRIAFDGLYPEKKPFIRFELGLGIISGNTSCNGFSSKYKMNGNAIHFEPLLSTMMACPGDAEKIFTGMLLKVNKYALGGDSTLTFLTDDVAVMRFVRK